MARSFLLSVVMLAAGCVQIHTPQAYVDLSDAEAAELGFSRVPVFYASSRVQTDSPYRKRSGGPTYGCCVVTVPDTHETGRLELSSVFRPDPGRFFTVGEPKRKSDDEFRRAIREKLQTLPGPRKRVLLFVHGFNSSFQQAILRAAQLSRDVEFDGVCAAYTWPSWEYPWWGMRLGYEWDEANAVWSAFQLADFLERLTQIETVDEVNVVTHSMGVRPLVFAMALRGHRLGRKPAANVIFAAPDIDADLIREMMPALKACAEHFTLYKSEEDFTLRVSRWLHGYPRAGGLGPSDGITTIDASWGAPAPFGHSYLFRDPRVLSDMRQLLNGVYEPGERGLEFQELPPQTALNELVSWVDGVLDYLRQALGFPPLAFHDRGTGAGEEGGQRPLAFAEPSTGAPDDSEESPPGPGFWRFPD